MDNFQNSAREKHELAFLNDAKSFFEDGEHILKNIYSPFSVNKCRNFFKYAEPIVRETLLTSAPHQDTILKDVKRFFEKAQETITQVFPQETISVKEYRDFFLNAERITLQTQVPIKKFQEFCKNAYPLLFEEYRKWITFIEKNNTGRSQKVNLLKVFGISGKEEAHSKFLVWLMKGEESHGLADIFLKKFINAVLERYPGIKDLSLEEVVIIPEASGEGGVPDIKIKGKGFLCIVENKIRAMEGKDQTKRYANDGEHDIKNMNISKERLFLIFLTPTGRLPLDRRFKPMDYQEIIALLRQILQSQQNINDSTRFLIEQFIFNLEMEILNIFDLEKKVGNCLTQYSKRGENYLWESQEDIYSIYNELMQKEG